jgi:hypothetical protein
MSTTTATTGRSRVGGPFRLAIEYVDQALVGISQEKLRNDHAQWCPMRLVQVLAIVLVCTMPFGFFRFLQYGILNHSISPETSAIWAGWWAIVSLWIILAKGLPDLLTNSRVIGTAWLLGGLANLMVAMVILVGSSQPGADHLFYGNSEPAGQQQSVGHPQ